VNKGKFPRIVLNFGIVFSIAFLIFIVSKTKIYNILELKALDLRFSLKTEQEATASIIHVDIDDSSLSELGRWPWPRGYHANLIDILTECGAKQIIFDVLFTERLKSSPEDDILLSKAIFRSGITYMPFYFITEREIVDAELEKLLIKDITISAQDAADALGLKVWQVEENLLSAKRHIMNKTVREIARKDSGANTENLIAKIEDSRGWFLFPAYKIYMIERLEKEKLIKLFSDRFGISYQKANSLNIRRYQDLVSPIKEYSLALKGSGAINAQPDVDGVMRRVPLFSKYGDKIFPHIGLAAIIDLLGIKHDDMKISNDFLSVKDVKIPVDEDGDMLVNWAGKWNTDFKHIPYHSILGLAKIREKLSVQSSVLEEDNNSGAVEYLKAAEGELVGKITKIVKDKICIVGLTATGTHDMRPMPLQIDYPMVGINSNMINTILSGNFIKQCGLGLNAVGFFVTALVVGCICLFKLWKSTTLSICYILGYFAVAFLLFDKLGLWIDLVGPIGIVVFGFSGITCYRYFTEEKEKVWIKHAFGHYLSGEVINELLADPSKLKLGGSRRRLTALFADVRGFTSFSEARQPEEVVASLNKYLAALADIVFEYNGTLDKFVGDELMAFFGAPGEIHAKDHAFFAVKTALEMQKRMKQLQEEWIQEGRADLHIGIGINTGDMIVGNMGSLKRMDYTIIGDNVNLAARLCGSAKKDEIIISAATYEDVKSLVKAISLEPIFVKGKAEAVSIYRVEGLV
jgi:adenylate cyclase